jgi:hypothetical protein
LLVVGRLCSFVVIARSRFQLLQAAFPARGSEEERGWCPITNDTERRPDGNVAFCPQTNKLLNFSRFLHHGHMTSLGACSDYLLLLQCLQVSVLCFMPELDIVFDEANIITANFRSSSPVMQATKPAPLSESDGEGPDDADAVVVVPTSRKVLLDDVFWRNALFLNCLLPVGVSVFWISVLICFC